MSKQETSWAIDLEMHFALCKSLEKFLAIVYMYINDERFLRITHTQMI